MNRVLCCVLILGLTALAWGEQAQELEIEDWPFDAAGRSVNIRDGELRIPLYDWSYNEGKTFRSSYTGKTYRVPDSMVALDYSSALFDTFSSNVGNISQVKHEESKSSGFFFGLPFFGLGKNKRKGIILELLKDRKSELFIVQKDLGVYSMASWTNPPLSSRFLRKLRELPRNYDQATYRSFLDYAGTHFFTQGTFGGQLVFYVRIDEEIYKYMKKTEVSRQIGAYVGITLLKIGFMTGTDKSELKVSETFKRYAKATCEIIPGDGYVGDCEKLSGYYKSWVEAVLNQPTLLTPQIYPLTTILASAAIPYKNEIKANLDRAILTYPTTLEGEDPAFNSAKRAADAEYFSFQREQKRKRALTGVAAPAATIDLVPGIRYLGMGYDVVTEQYRVLPVVQINPEPSNGLACDYQGCQSEHMTCWRDPIHRNLTYTLPRGVCIALVGTSESQLGSNAYMYRDAYESYFDSKTKKKKFLGLKRSSTHTHNYLKMFYEEDMALTMTQIWNQKYTLTLNAILGLPSRDLPLHPRFIEAVNGLPSMYVAKEYRDFIVRFGTHFVFDVTLGASLTSRDFFHRCLAYTYSDKYAERKSSTMLVVFAKKKGQFNADAELDAKWMEYSQSLVQFEGGNPFYFTADKYDDWLKTTHSNPAPITKTIEPIFEVVHRIDASKGLNVEKAFDAYVTEMAKRETNYEQILKKLDPMDKPSWCPSYPHNS